MRATRPIFSSSLNTTVFPLERLTIARVAKKFLSSYYPEVSLPCSHQSTTELHSEPAKHKFFLFHFITLIISVYISVILFVRKDPLRSQVSNVWFWKFSSGVYGDLSLLVCVAV